MHEADAHMLFSDCCLEGVFAVMQVVYVCAAHSTFLPSPCPNGVCSVSWGWRAVFLRTHTFPKCVRLLHTFTLFYHLLTFPRNTHLYTHCTAKYPRRDPEVFPATKRPRLAQKSASHGRMESPGAAGPGGSSKGVLAIRARDYWCVATCAAKAASQTAPAGVAMEPPPTWQRRHAHCSVGYISRDARSVDGTPTNGGAERNTPVGDEGKGISNANGTAEGSW